MRRRALVYTLGTVALSPLAGPFAAIAQQRGRTVRIGVLGTQSFFLQRFEAFRQGMRELGYVEGTNLVYVHRNAEGKLDRLPGLASELAREKVDLIFTASAEGVLAAMKSTSTIPIVFGSVQDPVASGIVDSLRRPGRNATGMSAQAPELVRKRLELLKEAIPGLAHVGFLWSPVSAGASAGLEQAMTAARLLGLQIQSLELRELEDLDRVLKSPHNASTGPQALLTSPDPLVNSQGRKIVAFALQNRLPVMYAAPERVRDAGGLMTYAPNYWNLWKDAATIAAKILKGDKPAETPVKQATQFDLVVSEGAAKAIGLVLPQAIRARAEMIP